MPEEVINYNSQGMNLSINITLPELPKCPKCEDQPLLPLPDQTREGNVFIKSWACPKCFHNISMKSGELVCLPVNQINKQKEL